MLKQKEDLIINLRYNAKQYMNDLNKANEILLISENRIDLLQDELATLETNNKNYLDLIEQEKIKNKVCHFIVFS